MGKIARIRQEIERRIDILTNVYAEQVERKDEEMMNYYHGKVIALEELRPFLDTLSEEPDKSLEEAAEEYEQTRQDTDARSDNEIVRRAFKAGWECRDEQMPMPEDTVLFNKGVAEGRRLEREDMMHDALEGYVAQRVHGKLYAKAPIPDEMGLKFGDKVRIVVLKEEEE